MAFKLPPLPFAQDALAPHLSADTLGFHHGKHHNAYVANLNNLVGETAMSLEDIIKESAADPAKAGVFNNAAQAWNHTFYWNSMKPGGGGAPSAKTAAGIDAAFGSFAKFKEEFTNAALTQFGSGWAWLVIDGGKFKVAKTANADTPIAHGQTPLITCDVWEHAYYLDFRNLRAKYVQTFLDNLVNWDFAEANLG